MGCFFGCFRAKDRRRPSPVVDTSRKARISRNQLSDLFVSQEREEELASAIQPQPLHAQCKEAPETNKGVYSNKQPLEPTTPAKLAGLGKGFDSVEEETPTSCISDLPTAGRNSVSATEKNNQCDSNTSTTLVSSGSPNAHNWNGLAVSGNQRHPPQKHKNKPTPLQEDLEVQGSLSSWLKPVQHDKLRKKVNFKAELDTYGRSGSTPGDRPILGTVAAHWSQKVEPAPVPLKWWDGNGIPNSTNKYREDQKVSWHVTPFEERLEKALSEENSISQRKHISGTHMAFEDSEVDTAASQLQSLPQPKSVISF
uniref:Protein JASON n=1 Tax=Kalanchoe fedtschenkoi TaxID=63787 RepID=A0A7N0T2R3_KALFE